MEEKKSQSHSKILINSSTNVLSNLPDDILAYCFCFLNLFELSQVMRTCKQWNRCANRNEVWKMKFIESWGLKLSEQEKAIDSWKLFYIKQIQIWNEAAKLFNESPENAFLFLQKEGETLDNNTLISFFMRHSNLDKKKVGEILANNTELIRNFFERMNFRDIEIDNALRLYLSRAYLPGSAQKINTVILEFSTKYFSENPNSFFDSSDNVFTLTFLILLTNTDLHSEQIKRKITLPTFLKMANSTNSKFPEGYAEAMYYRIKENPMLEKPPKFESKKTGIRALLSKFGFK